MELHLQLVYEKKNSICDACNDGEVHQFFSDVPHCRRRLRHVLLNPKTDFEKK